MALLFSAVLFLAAPTAVWLLAADAQGAMLTKLIQAGVGGLIFAALLLGMGSGRGGRKTTRLAGAAVILSALAAAVGLYLWYRCDITIEEALRPRLTEVGLNLATLCRVPETMTTPFLIGAIFVAHSLWGWMLLLFARRLR